MNHDFWEAAHDKLTAARAADVADIEDALDACVGNLLEHLLLALDEEEEVPHGVEP